MEVITHRELFSGSNFGQERRPLPGSKSRRLKKRRAAAGDVSKAKNVVFALLTLLR